MKLQGCEDEMVNIGIVGCGLISRVHLRALRGINKCEVISVCDISRNRAVALANEFNIPKVYTDFSSMLQKENLDIIHVLVPPQVHARLSIEAMEAGCSVLVEKPMCVTVKEADQMIKAANQNRVTLGVIHSFLFNPGIRKALTAVRQGKIGDLLWVDTVISIHSLLKYKKYLKNTWYETLPGGVFGEIIPHGVYVQLAFLGGIKKVTGVLRKNGEESALTPFSELEILMDGENSIGSLLMSTRIKSPYTLTMVRAVGSRQTLLVNVPTGTVIELKPEKSRIFSRSLMNLRPALQLIHQSASLGIKALSRSVKSEMTHKTIIQGFIESVRKGSAPLVTAEEGREVVRAINMIWESILT